MLSCPLVSLLLQVHDIKFMYCITIKRDSLGRLSPAYNEEYRKEMFNINKH